MIRSPTFIRSRQRHGMMMIAGLVAAENIRAPRSQPFTAWGCNAMYRVARAKVARALARNFLDRDMRWKVLQAPPQIFPLPGAKGPCWQWPPVSMPLPPARPVNWSLLGGK